MEPNLLKECAQRLIETADFIRGGEVSGGSASSSSTSNTQPRPARPDDNNSIPSGCTGSNTAVPNSAPSVSESARQEHNRIFGYRPPGSSRQSRNSKQSGNSGRTYRTHASGRQAANASWSRSFICLASAGQCCPPSTSERIELALNGLGEKKKLHSLKKEMLEMYTRRLLNAFQLCTQGTSCSNPEMAGRKICCLFQCHRTGSLWHI